ncbi:MAG: hypothetical protein QXF75_00950 [Candidatus Bathyarchaeia archaeon]
MVYEELLKFWKKENDSGELESLPSDFYFQIAEYMKRLKEEERMIDRKTLKANLLKIEMKNVEHMVRQLAKKRYKKIVQLLTKDQKIPFDLLTTHERNMFAEKNLSFADAFKNFLNNLMRGSLTENVVETPRKMVVVRFLKEVPAIVGTDMKIYGPFKCEDIASLPFENVKILIKQKLAEKIDF